MKNIQTGFCHCGCGQKTKIAKRTYRRRGWFKGEPVKFVSGHNFRLTIGDKNNNWNGGKTIDSHGYVKIRKLDHPRANTIGYVKEHILIAEKALGKPLPPKAQIHHLNGDRADNRNENLLICEDDPYHKLLHRRKIAFTACGNSHWKKCLFCKSWDDPKNMNVSKNRYLTYHMVCGKLNYKQKKQLGRMKKMAIDLKTRLAGVTFEGRQANIDKYAFLNSKYQLHRQPQNKFDANAIMVTANGRDIGYIPKALASEIAPIMDAGTALRCHFRYCNVVAPDKPKNITIRIWG